MTVHAHLLTLKYIKNGIAINICPTSPNITPIKKPKVII